MPFSSSLQEQPKKAEGHAASRLFRRSRFHAMTNASERVRNYRYTAQSDINPKPPKLAKGYPAPCTEAYARASEGVETHFQG